MRKAPETREIGRPRFGLRFALLVVTFVCVVAFLIPWTLRRIALDPFSPDAGVRDRLLRDPFAEPTVKRSTPHTDPNVRDVQQLPLDLEKADPALVEKLKQSAQVMYADVPIGDVLDDLSVKYDIAFDTQGIADTDAKVVLFAHDSLQSVLQAILREVNLYCKVDGNVMKVRPGDDTSSQGRSSDSPNSGRTRDEDSDPSDTAVDPFAN